MLISYLSLFVIIISNNSKALSKVFDSISTNLFTNIYFPSTYAYLFVMIVIDIVTITSVLNRKIKNSYKVANGICFFSTKFILALIMEVVATNNIDIFEKKSLFGNKKLVMLLETSMNIFILWILAIMVIYITDKVVERMVARDEEQKLDVTDAKMLHELVVEDDIDEAHDEYVDDNSVIPDYTTNSDVIHLVDDDFDEQTNTNLEQKLPEPQPQYTDSFINNISLNNDMVENNTADTLSSDELFDKLLTNGLPLIKEEQADVKTDSIVQTPPSIETVDVKQTSQNVSNSPKDGYTLNDYKIFNKILKEIQRTNNGNIINIDRSLEIRLLMKYTEEEYYLFKGMLKNYSN